MSNASVQEVSRRFSLCVPLPASRAEDKGKLADDLGFLAMQTFANLNMANYPPDNTTGLHLACQRFAAAAEQGSEALLDAMRTLLLTQTQVAVLGGRGALVTEARYRGAPCFDLGRQRPAGGSATARCGDWSGCGTGRDGEMWDYQTCTFEVEHIGFGTPSQMFPARPWTYEWMTEHCGRRFGVAPQPRALADLWGFDLENLRSQTSRIVFTNGLNDGWSVGSVLESPAPEKDLIAINLPNGAHHSELSHRDGSAIDTDDVKEAKLRITQLLRQWLQESRTNSEAIHV